MSDVLEAALDYARQGWKVHPCHASDKKPYTRWGNAATTDEDMIRRWWKGWPTAVIGLCTGGGLVVVDVDPRHGGEFDEDMARTLTATTPGGGWHHYFLALERVPNAVGIIPGVDVRGERGYVIAPGSPGYAWMNEATRLPLPAVITDLMQARRDAVTKRFGGSGFEPAEAGSIGEGMRHDYMIRFAGFAIRTLEVSGEQLEIECMHEYQRACSPADAPLGNIRRIARSIERKHRASA